MTFDRPVVAERSDREREYGAASAGGTPWVNKARSSRYSDAGSMRTSQVLTFRWRWDERMRAIPQDMQSFRVVYEGVAYSVEDTDDYMQRHRVFEVEGASYGS